MSIEKIDDWDWPDYLYEPDGYDQKRVPTATTANVQFLANRLNEAIEIIARLESRLAPLCGTDGDTQ